MVRASFLALMLLFCGLLFAQVLDLQPEAEADTLNGTLPEADIVEEYTVEDLAERVPEVQKSEVLAWIGQARALDSRDEILWQSLDNLQLQYRFGSSTVQMHGDPYELRVYGFERPQSMMDRAIYLDYFSRYHHFDYSQGSIDAGHFEYALPVAVSGLQGSLGDYDSRDVSAFLAKGGVFGFEGANLQLNYSLQNGYWLDQTKSGSSMRPYLSYRYNDFEWAMEYASYQKEGSALELLPYYWAQSSYRIKHKYSHFYTHLKHPWLSISLINSNERVQSTSYQKSLSTEALQLALQRDFLLPSQSLSLRYEYAEIKRNADHVFTYNGEDYEHKLGAVLTNSAVLDLQAKAELLDWARLRTNVRLQKSLGRLSLGVYDRHNWADRDSSYILQNPIDGALMSGLSINSDAESGVFGSWQNHTLKLNSTLAYQSLSQRSLLQDLSDEQLLLRLSAEYKPRFGDWEISLLPTWKMQDFSLYLMENPQFSFSSSQSITRHLGHENALSVGFRIHGHSDYYLANVVNPVLVEASTTLDLWTQVKVGPLFDFSVSAQNVLDTSLFGVYAIPFSVHARLRWYFLN